MSKASQALTDSGAPNNILTRMLWHVAYRTIQFGVMGTALVTGKDPLEVANSLSNKLEGLNPNK